MMKLTSTTTYYCVTFSYNAGLLGADKDFATYEEAKAFAEDYKVNFPDDSKYYHINRFERKKFLNFTTSFKMTRVESWSE